jgi:AcrR family transcriptional regulator
MSYAEPHGAKADRPRSQRYYEIMQVAAELFVQKGFHSVGMRDIANEIGIKTASLYYHFASKEDLLYAICLNVSREYNSGEIPILSGPGSHTQRLGTLVRDHILYFAPRRKQYLVTLSESSQLTPEHFREVWKHPRIFQQALTDFIADGVEAGEFHVLDPRIASLALLDMINGMLRWLHDDGPYSLVQIADMYASMAFALVDAETSHEHRPRVERG